MQAEFRAPRRRPRITEEFEASLPLSPRGSSHFRAELFNQHVLVCDPDHSRKIHNQDPEKSSEATPTSPETWSVCPGSQDQGYFGKGVLSRARPEHSISDQWERHEGVFLPVVSQSRYEELLVWAGSALSAQGWDEEAVNQTLLRLSQPMEMEDVRKAIGGGQEAEENGEKGKPEGGVSPNRKRLRPVSEVKPEVKKSCSSDLDPDSNSSSDSDPDTDSDSDPDPAPLVPGPGFLLLVSDSEAGGRVMEVRRTPFFLPEYLQLSLEEAFFLVYGLGCLSVYLQQEPLTIMQLWKKFCSLRPDFVSSYAAYHHFRSKGWVPKEGGGAKYGVNLMLYRKGPPFYHASYSVVIERADDAFGGSALRPFSWRSLAALSRITANVSKELMLCYIIYPVDLSEHELDSPECLSRLKIQEVIVSRWVSSRERVEQDDI